MVSTQQIEASVSDTAVGEAPANAGVEDASIPARPASMVLTSASDLLARLRTERPDN